MPTSSGPASYDAMITRATAVLLLSRDRRVKATPAEIDLEYSVATQVLRPTQPLEVSFNSTVESWLLPGASIEQSACFKGSLKRRHHALFRSASLAGLVVKPMLPLSAQP